MKRTRIFAVLTLTALFALLATMVFAQDADKPVTVGEILKTAKVPLTDEQAKQLKEIKPGMDRSVFRQINEMFDEKQTAALKEALGSQPGRNDGPERPRNLIQVIMLENAGSPITASQLAKMKEIPAGQGSREAMMEIYTDKQKEIMQGMFGNR